MFNVGDSVRIIPAKFCLSNCETCGHVGVITEIINDYYAYVSGNYWPISLAHLELVNNNPLRTKVIPLPLPG